MIRSKQFLSQYLANLSNSSGGYWNKKENVKTFLQNLQVKLSLQSASDWDSITCKCIAENGGGTILKYFTLFEIKCIGYPEGKSTFIAKRPQSYWQKLENIQGFIFALEKKLNINSPKDWNKVKKLDIESMAGGYSILAYYTMYEIKCLACPDDILSFDQPNKSNGYWENRDNVNQFLQDLKINLNLKTPEDWNSITTTQIKINGGSTLLQKYSIYDIKCLGCPEGILLFNDPIKPAKYWDHDENITNFINKLKEAYKLESESDWNSLTIKQIKEQGGSSLLRDYSLYDIKCLGFPESKSFSNQKPFGFWDDKKNVKNFLEKLKEKYNLTTPQDWNKISRKMILDQKEQGGPNLLRYYNLYQLKCIGCPEGQSLFSPTNIFGYWDNKDNIMNFMADLKKKLNLQTFEDWNSITAKQIKLYGASTLLQKYSMYDIKCFGCPEGEFLYEKPKKLAKFWKNEENIKKFINELKIKFSISNNEDWNRVSKAQILSNGGSGLFFLSDDIIKKIPEISFIIYDKKLSYRPSQRWLFLQVQKLFPGEEIIEDYYHSEISRKTGRNVQFDVFLVKRKIAFEYHGIQHYEDIPAGFATLELYQNRDIEKENLCKEFGIQLVIIPYWWDNKIHSLNTTIKEKLSLP